MRTASIATLVCLLWSVPAGAQAKPDFSGTWVEDETARKVSPPASNSGGAKSLALPPSDTVIRHTPAALTIERTFMSSTIRYVYALDGTESVNHNGANTQTTRSRWDGGKLITEGTSYSSTSQGEFTWRYREVRWLDAKRAMVVETTNTDEAGKTSMVTCVFRQKRSKR